MTNLENRLSKLEQALKPDAPGALVWLESPPDLSGATPEAWAAGQQAMLSGYVWHFEPSPWTAGLTWLLIGITPESGLLEKINRAYGPDKEL